MPSRSMVVANSLWIVAEEAIRSEIGAYPTRIPDRPPATVLPERRSNTKDPVLRAERFRTSKLHTNPQADKSNEMRGGKKTIIIIWSNDPCLIPNSTPILSRNLRCSSMFLNECEALWLVDQAFGYSTDNAFARLR